MTIKLYLCRETHNSGIAISIFIEVQSAVLNLLPDAFQAAKTVILSKKQDAIFVPHYKKFFSGLAKV